MPPPLAGGGHSSSVSAEPDQPGVVAVPFADKLTQRQLTVSPHFVRPSITDMRVVCPHNDSRWRVLTLAVQMRQQRVQRVGHVLVPQIPRRHAAAKHSPVVALGVAHDLCVLLSIEQLILGEQPVPARVGQRISLEVDQLIDGLPLTRQAGSECRSESVGLAVIGG